MSVYSYFTKMEIHHLHWVNVSEHYKKHILKLYKVKKQQQQQFTKKILSYQETIKTILQHELTQKEYQTLQHRGEILMVLKARK